MDFVSSINSDIICRSGGSITTAIHLLNACYITAIDDDLRILVTDICRLVASQVAATIYSKYIVFLVSNGFYILVKSSRLGSSVSATINLSLKCVNLICRQDSGCDFLKVVIIGIVSIVRNGISTLHTLELRIFGGNCSLVLMLRSIDMY